MGYDKVSQQKLDVALKIRDYVFGGGFMFEDVDAGGGNQMVSADAVGMLPCCWTTPSGRNYKWY